MKVLLVEDDATIRRGVVRLLRQMFDKVDPRAAESVDEAIDQLIEATLDTPFDLVISDFNLLGNRTGAELIDWIREHASFLDARFLFLTGDERAKRHHHNFLAKPATAVEFRKAIEDTLTGARSQ